MRPLLVHDFGAQASEQPKRLLPRWNHVAAVAAVAGIFMVLGESWAAAVATLILAVVVVVFEKVGYAWNQAVSGPREPEVPGGDADKTTAFLALASALVTLQGVVITLIFSFLGANEASFVIELGAAALVLGLLSGLVTAFLVAPGISSRLQLRMAGHGLRVTAWACSYGLLCVAMAVIVER